MDDYFDKSYQAVLQTHIFAAFLLRNLLSWRIGLLYKAGQFRIPVLRELRQRSTITLLPLS
jgi:hypothetical protein